MSNSEYDELRIEPAYATYKDGVLENIGLTKLEIICIQLKVPNTDNSYLNQLILKSRVLDIMERSQRPIHCGNISDTMSYVEKNSGFIDDKWGIE